MQEGPQQARAAKPATASGPACASATAASADPADLADFRQRARDWLAANVAPRDPGAQQRPAHEVPPEELARDLARDRSLQRAMHQAGYVGITLPTEYGGQGLSKRHQLAWSDESAGYALPAPGGVAGGVTLSVILPTLLAHASEQQKREWIPRMLSSDEIWVQLLSEPGAGSDLAGIHTKAVRDGDNWVLTGSKIWSSGAMSADYGICLARTDWDVPKHRGLTWFKVPLHDDRVTVRPVREINGGAEFCEEFLDGVTVDNSMVIGEVNGGWPIAATMLGFERGNVSGQRESAGTASSQRRLAPDLVELAVARGAAADPVVRQLIARAHINDYVQARLAARVMAATMAGTADQAAASLIKLEAWCHHAPLRAAWRRWRSRVDPGHRLGRRRARRRGGGELPQRPDHVHRRWQQPDPAQHHRRTDPRPAPRAERRLGQALPRGPPRRSPVGHQGLEPPSPQPRSISAISSTLSRSSLPDATRTP